MRLYGKCRRTAECIKDMVKNGWSDYIQKTTGLVPDAYFSASKIAWILDNVEGARKRLEAGDLLFGTIDTWLIWNLTKGSVHVTDYTNASRTMMFDIHNLCWDEKILAYFWYSKVNASKGVSDQTACMDTLIRNTYCKIPIARAAGDQQAALFGSMLFLRKEKLKIHMGQVAFC